MGGGSVAHPPPAQGPCSHSASSPPSPSCRYGGRCRSRPLAPGSWDPDPTPPPSPGAAQAVWGSPIGFWDWSSLPKLASQSGFFLLLPSARRATPSTSPGEVLLLPYVSRRLVGSTACTWWLPLLLSAVVSGRVELGDCCQGGDAGFSRRRACRSFGHTMALMMCNESTTPGAWGGALPLHKASPWCSRARSPLCSCCSWWICSESVAPGARGASCLRINPPSSQLAALILRSSACS